MRQPKSKRRGSVRINGQWVSIPLGTRRNPLTDDEQAEAKAIIAKAEAKQDEPDRYFVHTWKRGLHEVVDRFGGRPQARLTTKREADQLARRMNTDAAKRGVLRGGEAA